MFNRAVPPQDYSMNLLTESISQLRNHLERSLRFRILNVPVPPISKNDPSDVHPVRLAILFSGGLDCTVLARMAHGILPAEQEIDLINVAFENPRVVEAARRAAQKNQKGMDDSNHTERHKRKSAFENCPDRETGRNSFKELCQVCPGRTWRFVAVSRDGMLSR
jgi:asparagine synthetase B (glutamine-hydrolysing)